MMDAKNDDAKERLFARLDTEAGEPVVVPSRAEVEAAFVSAAQDLRRAVAHPRGKQIDPKLRFR